MRKLLLILALLVPVLGWAGTCGNGYSFSQKLIIKHSLVGNTTTLTNFPYLVPFNGAASSSITLADLKTVANSGSIQHTAANSAGVTGPADFIVCDAASAGTAIKFEIAQYTATSGKMEMWVQIASLSNSVDQNIWIFYGNSGVSTTQQDLSLWADANYVGVFHTSDGSTLSATDSTGTLTAAKVGSPTAVTGITDGAMGAVSASNYINITQNAAMRVASTLTVEGWANPTTCASFGTIVSVPYATSGWSAPYQSWSLNTYSTNCQSRFVVSSSGSNHGIDNQGPVMYLSQWNQLVGTFDGTTVRAYLNGLQSGTTAFSGTITYPVNADVAIGQRGTYSTGDQFDGSIDEVRIANATMTADWIKTEYKNISGLTTQLYLANCGSGYAFNVKLKPVKASGSDQTNYPLRVWGRDYRLATVANGGQVQNTTTSINTGVTIPADVQFCPDQTGTGTPLKYEAVDYVAATGDFEYWVQQPTYHSGSFDSVYLYANNSSVTTSQEDLSLWTDINAWAVYHFADGGTLNVKNSVTGTALTQVGTINPAPQGLDGSADTTGATTDYMKFPRTAATEPSSAITMEGLWYITGTGGDGNDTFISKPWRTSGWTSPFASYRLVAGNNGTQLFSCINTSATFTCAGSAAIIPFLNWEYFAGTYDGANVKSWVNGVNDGTQAKSGSIDYSGGTTDLDIGADTQYATVDYDSSRKGEIRIYSDAKSADWIATTALHLNQYQSSFVFDETSYAKPQIRQFASCGKGSGVATCTFPFDLTAGGFIVVINSCFNTGCSNPCPAMSNDSAGLAYTLRASGDKTGTLQHYYSCMYTSPIGATTGADTISIPTSDQSSAVVMEVKGITLSGAVYLGSSGVDTPTLTLTSPGADSLLVCATYDGTNGATNSRLRTTVTPTSLRTGITPQVTVSASHQSIIGYAYGLVASGSQSCQFGTGTTGVMAIFGSSPVSGSTVRHRVVNY
jgi:hypothetical protein